MSHDSAWLGWYAPWTAPAPTCHTLPTRRDSKRDSMAKRIRGRRHPGVTLKRPDPERRIGWRAQYVDPDSGSTVRETVPAALTTAELREDWAVRKSKALALRRLELESGAT